MAHQYDDARSLDEGEVDLGRYAAALGRRWRLVASVTAVAVAAAAAVTVCLGAVAPRYQAQATVLLTGAKYQLQLDPKFTTVDMLNVASATRAEEFQALAASPDVQHTAMSQMDPAVGASEIPAVDVKAKGNILTVTATAADSKRAAAWANAYATAAASRLDAVYGVGDADRSALEKQLADAVAKQDAAVARLTQFTREDRTDALNREIAQKQLAIQTLTSQQDGLLRARLAAFYQTSADLEQVRRDAESLRNQIQNAALAPASTAAQALALMNLQTRLTEAGHTRLDLDTPARPQSPNQPQPQPVDSAPRTTAPSGPQLQVGIDSLIGRSASQQDMLRDLDAVIAQAQQRQAAMQAEFDKTMAVVQQRVGTPGANLATGPDDQTKGVVDRLTADIQALRAQVQELQQRRDVLTQDVELAKTARTTLETKLRESSISAATSGGKAVVAASAVPPTAPSFPPPLSRTLPLAAFVGLLLGGFAAVVVDSAGRPGPGDRGPVPEPVWHEETPAAAGSLGE